MGQFDGKVVFVTGAARGQGRSHAVRFAEEGADVIAMDICEQIDGVVYPMARPEDLEETVNLVEKTGRRIIAEQGDVRNFARLQQIVANGVAELGRIDFVLANAGIGAGMDEQADSIANFGTSVDVMLKGVYYTIEATLPALLSHGGGGAIVITSSTGGLKSLSPAFDTRRHGLAGYNAAKHGVVGLMRYYAVSLAEKNIRVNTVHPTGVNTPMIVNEVTEQYMAARPEMAQSLQNLLPVDLVEPGDVSDAMMYLCGNGGRYITGITLPVDAGFAVK